MPSVRLIETTGRSNGSVSEPCTGPSTLLKTMTPTAPPPLALRAFSWKVKPPPRSTSAILPGGDPVQEVGRRAQAAERHRAVDLPGARVVHRQRLDLARLDIRVKVEPLSRKVVMLNGWRVTA